jgi:hypothetical protein
MNAERRAEGFTSSKTGDEVKPSFLTGSAFRVHRSAFIVSEE